MKTINDIFEMLDLFYANIHLFKRLRKKPRKQKRRSDTRWKDKRKGYLM